MTAETINSDGSPVRIEAVYWRHFVVYAYEADSIEDARGFLAMGDEEGNMSSVGVFVDGEPRLTDVWVEPHTPDEQEAASMRETYAKRLGGVQGGRS